MSYAHQPNLQPTELPAEGRAADRYTAGDVIPSPHWHLLDEVHHALTEIVPETSAPLERTTVLTWLYRNQGFLSFSEIMEKHTGPGGTSVKRKRCKRMLQSLAKIGTITVFELPTLIGQATELNDDGDEDRMAHGTDGDAEQDDGEGAGVLITDNSGIHLTSDGMLWMKRAWRARSVSMGPRPLIVIHADLLEEEEEGKGNEPYWIESIGYNKQSTGDMTPKGEVSRWIGPSVSNVFDLGFHAQPNAKTTKAVEP